MTQTSDSALSMSLRGTVHCMKTVHEKKLQLQYTLIEQSLYYICIYIPLLLQACMSPIHPWSDMTVHSKPAIFIATHWSN